VAAARPTRPLAERLELASACSELEPLSFGLKAVLQSLEVRMGGRGVGAHRLDLTLELAGKAPLTVELPLGRPLRSATALLTIAKEHLASIRLPAAVEAISVTVAEWAPWRGRQLDLLDRTEGAGEELDELLARLSAVLGKEAVFAARVERRHRPERAYETKAFDPPGHTRDLLSRRAAAAPVGGRRPTVLLPQPVPLAWTGDWVEAVVQGSALRRRASTVSQPERLVGEWWSEPFHRDYHVLSLQDGTRWWIFRDMISDVWFLHGVFE
jgi:protein ImuB